MDGRRLIPAIFDALLRERLDFHLRRPSLGETQRNGRLIGHIDNTIRGKGAAIIDPQDHAPLVLQIADADITGG